MAGKSALVTGACGYSAPWVIEKLLEEGWKIRATDLGNAPKQNLTKFENKIEFIPADLTKPDTLKPIISDIDVVFHTAAVFSYSAPMELLRKVNVDGTKNLITQCLNSNVKKMVMWSSVATYGSADPKFYKIPIKECQIGEMNPKNEGKYDCSKREQEEVAMQFWIENKFPISFMRLAPLYGPGSYYGMFALFKYINDEVLSVCPSNLGNRKASIPLVHVEDVARAALFLSNPNIGNGEAFNIADDNVLDLIETCKFIANLTGSSFKVIIPIPMKLLYYLLKIMGKISVFEANHFRQKVNGRPPIPHLESDLLVYLNGNFWFDNAKIKSLGFQFKWADRRPGLIESIDWYNKFGWEKKMAIKGLDQMEARK